MLDSSNNPEYLFNSVILCQKDSFSVIGSFIATVFLLVTFKVDMFARIFVHQFIGEGRVAFWPIQQDGNRK